MTKSDLIETLAYRQTHLAAKDVELSVKIILEQMSNALSAGGRIEIRGFGSFSLHFRPPRTGRNPKTGESVDLNGKYVPHFKPGKQLRERVMDSAGTPIKEWFLELGVDNCINTMTYFGLSDAVKLFFYRDF